MRSVIALLRAAWLSATSYRLASVLSIASALATILPIFFVSDAIQTIAADSIGRESPSYFGFVMVGTCGLYLIGTATSTLPGAVASNIGNGTLEALFVTRTPMPYILLGLSSYSLVQTVIRIGILLVGAAVLGVRMAWFMLPAAVGIAFLLVCAHVGIGLVSTALILVFRTSGPLTTVVMTVSTLLGGVYYAATAVPGWLQPLTAFVPLTYALRAGRMLLLGGAALGDVVPDVSALLLMAVVSMIVGTVSFRVALQRARKTGTLSQY